MRVMVYKARDGVRDILLLPSAAARRGPVLLPGLEKVDVRSKVKGALGVGSLRQKPLPGLEE